MPNLKHLLDGLESIGVEPNEIELDGSLFDALMAQGEEVVDSESEEED